MDDFSFAEEKVIPGCPYGGCNFLRHMRVDGKMLCVRFNHFVKRTFRKAKLLNHILPLLEKAFLFLAVGNSFRNGCHQSTILVCLVQLMPHFRSCTDKLIIDSAAFLKFLVQIVLLIEIDIQRQCQYK